MTKSQAMAFRKYYREDGSASAETLAEVYEALYGHPPTADEVELGQVWDLICSWFPGA